MRTAEILKIKKFNSLNSSHKTKFFLTKIKVYEKTKTASFFTRMLKLTLEIVVICVVVTTCQGLWHIL